MNPTIIIRGEGIPEYRNSIFCLCFYFYHCYCFLHSSGVYFLHTIYCFLSLGVIFRCFMRFRPFHLLSKASHSEPCHSKNSKTSHILLYYVMTNLLKINSMSHLAPKTPQLCQIGWAQKVKLCNSTFSGITNSFNLLLSDQFYFQQETMKRPERGVSVPVSTGYQTVRMFYYGNEVFIHKSYM